jgi:hypothetical protein
VFIQSATKLFREGFQMARIVKPGEAVKVTIVTNTMAPIKSIALAQLNMTGDMRHSLGDVSLGEAEDIFKDLCKTELQGAFEFVHFNIQMEGVTRAFQQQLTRTRLASYSAEWKFLPDLEFGRATRVAWTGLPICNGRWSG